MFKIIISVDVETEGLEATPEKFILASIYTEKDKTEIYNNPKQLWKRIIQLGISEAKKGKVLNVYSHNAQYDTATYINLKDKNLVYFCNKPFIWSYKPKKDWLNKHKIKTEKTSKEIIKFLDTMNIYTKQSLKSVGELVKNPKQEINIENITKETLDEKTRKQLEEYCINDSKICILAIKHIKNKLQQEGINLKRIYTINQIARQYIWKKWLELPEKYKTPYFWNDKTGMTRNTIYTEEIHNAYRGGRCEAWKTGKIENCTEIDINSLYPWSATQIKTPDIRTEKKTYIRTKQEEKEYHEKLIHKIGLSKAIIKNINNEIGLLQIRTEKDNYYPKPGQTFIGTYTNIELQKAKEEGYEIIAVDWTITYEEAPNPFKIIFPEIYKKRLETTGFDNWFYKMMMNASIGKMAQHRTDQEIIIDDIEKTKEYLEKNWKIIESYGMNNMFKKQEKIINKKSYYIPQIPMLINAHARIRMYEEYKKIGKENLIYTDTDNIIHTKKEERTSKNEMGEFKIVSENQEVLIYGKKTLSIGNQIKISGITKKDITKQDFEQGKVKTKRQITIKTAKEIKEVGKFQTEERNLIRQNQDYIKRQEILENEEILIDSDLSHINYLLIKLNETL